MADRKRQGGLRVDPAVAAWQKGAATNERALSGKQKYDRARVRVRIDVPAVVAEGLTQEAAAMQTSGSQLGAFLLAWALFRLHSGDEALLQAVTDAHQDSRAINVRYDLVIPDEVLERH